MPRASVLVPDTGTKKAHFWQRTYPTIGDALDEFIAHGEPGDPAYMVPILTAAPASNDHLLSLQAGASLPVKIRWIRVRQVGNAAAAGVISLELRRLSAVAHLGGTAITPAPLDSTDAASGATARSIPTTKGTEGVLIGHQPIVVRQAIATTATQIDGIVEWDFDRLRSKPLTIAAGTTNGIALKATAGTTATFSVELCFVEQNFV
jgi:hypothetical protein